MTYAFPFMNRFYGKSGLLNMIIFPFLFSRISAVRSEAL